MKFDYIIGNPPYQEERIDGNVTFSPPIYNCFLDAAYTMSDKVEMIQGYVGNKDDGMDKITLDRVLSGKSVDYIKMDIEGYERGALEGAKGILDTSDRLSCAICAYHCEGDEAWIRAFFEKHGYETDCSGGYMCPDWCSDGLLKAQLRRGVVFARKKDCSKS